VEEPLALLYGANLLLDSARHQGYIAPRAGPCIEVCFSGDFTPSSSSLQDKLPASTKPPP
jgi:hypothetical protein